MRRIKTMPRHGTQRPRAVLFLVIASGAKQSSAPCKRPLDCFVAKLLAMTREIILAMHLRIRAFVHAARKPFQAPPDEGRQSAERRTHGPCLAGTTAAPSGTARLPALHRGSHQKPADNWLSSRPRFLGRGETCDQENRFPNNHTPVRQTDGRYPPSPVPVQGLHLPHRS